MSSAPMTHAATVAGPAPSAAPRTREGWFAGRDAERCRTTALLDADPDLGARLTPAERAAARRHLGVAVRRFDRGPWAPDADGVPLPLGYLVLTGTLIHGSCVGDRWSTEILGPGDVLRPWEEEEGLEDLKLEQEWQALETVEVAVLDRRFAMVACRWPELIDELLGRTVRRSRHLAMLRGIAGIRRLDDRLLLLLRVLADRWGRVCPEGVRLDLPLTHETLARLAGAQRPSVSTALARLTRDGSIARRGRVFVLPSPASATRRQPAGLEELRSR